MYSVILHYLQPFDMKIIIFNNLYNIIITCREQYNYVIEKLSNWVTVGYLICKPRPPLNWTNTFLLPTHHNKIEIFKTYMIDYYITLH